jgi:hypothetical protein
MVKIRFNDKAMQTNYEFLIIQGMHWKKAERKTIEAFKEYDEVKYLRR